MYHSHTHHFPMKFLRFGMFFFVMMFALKALSFLFVPLLIGGMVFLVTQKVGGHTHTKQAFKQNWHHWKHAMRGSWATCSEDMDEKPKRNGFEDEKRKNSSEQSDITYL